MFKVRGKDLISFYPQQILAAVEGWPYIYIGFKEQLCLAI